MFLSRKLNVTVCMCSGAGAGKTTTFRMLTGDLNPTSGSATICGLDVATEFKKVCIRIKCHQWRMICFVDNYIIIMMAKFVLVVHAS